LTLRRFAIDTTRTVRAAARDLRLFVTGKRDPDLPPHRYRRVGAGDFRLMGRWLADLLVRNGLQPDHHVLDIGCGIGRVALALTDVLSPNASYDGFDVDGRAVRWAAEHITPRHPNFRFVHANIAARRHERQAVPATQFRFPWPDATFDFAFATSVFTHLEINAARHYLREAHRVLRPGGTLVATIFLYDGTPSKLAFPVDRGEDLLMDAHDLGRGVGFRERSLVTLLRPHEWTDVQVQPGGWQQGGTFSVKTQDVLTARRT
jgi:SAM-dependent methyltransferase